MNDEQDTSGSDIPEFTNHDTFDGHEWIQRGYMLEHNCQGACASVPQGIRIPAGKMLVKEGGKYTLVNEIAARV